MMLALKLFFIICLSRVGLSTQVVPEILDGPVTQTVPVTQYEAQFTCHARASAVFWYINGETLFNNIPSWIILYDDIHDFPNVEVTRRIGVRTQGRNRTKIECLATGSDQATDRSEPPVFLYIVDVLNAPVTELVTVNTTALRVSWFEPFAHTGFPILNYTLIIRSTADHSAPLYNASLSALEYVLTTDSVHRDCHNITFEIIATNSIGPSAAGVAIGGFPILLGDFLLPPVVVATFTADFTPIINITFKPPTVCWFQNASYELRILDASTQALSLSTRNGIYHGSGIATISEAYNDGVDLEKVYDVIVIIDTLTGTKNASSRFNTSYIITPQGGIELNRENKTLFSNEGAEFNRLCRYTGDTNMLDELQWIHNGDLSQPVRNTSSSSALPLAIENVQLSHAGEYSCRVVLNNGSVVGPVSAGFLNVADSSQLIVPPKQYVLKGGSITLEYSTTLTDNVLGVWQHASSNTPVDPVITNAQVENELAGEYRYNILFYLTDTADQVNTQRQSEAIVIVPPWITAYSQSPIQVSGGSTQSLRVSFVSRTMNSTTVSWTRLSGNMPSGAQVETVWLDDGFGNATTSLNFNSLTRSDSGQYQVTITNSYEVVPVDQRTVSKMFEFTVKVPPALPTSLTAASINTTRYNITWTLTHTTPDQQASTLFINVFQPSPTIIQVPSSVSEIFVFEVEPGNDYILSLTAANVDGSVSTDPVVFTTPAAAPLIISADVQRLNSTALSLTFDLHYTGGGDITTISLSVNGRTFPVSDVRSTSRNTWTGMVVSDEVMSLEYSTDLEFSVSLTNQRSLTMAASTRQSFILPGAPTVQMSVTETSIILQVTLLGIATEPIEYIVVEIRDSTQLVAMTNRTGAFSRGEVVEVTVGGLSPGTQYTAVAYGVNAGGAGEQSSLFTFSTADSSMILSQEAMIGVTIVGSVVGTVALVLAIIGCFYCIRRCKTGGGKKYCTAEAIGFTNGQKN